MICFKVCQFLDYSQLTLLPAKDVALPPCQPGDLLAVMDTGAYGAAMARSNFIAFSQKGPLLSAFTPTSKAHFTFLLQQLQHEGPSGRGSRGRNFPEDCGKEGGVCGHCGQVEDIMWTVHTILFILFSVQFIFY